MESYKKMIDILKSHDIEIEIWSCGCCESPKISFKYKNELIVDGVYGINIDFDDFKGKNENT